MYQLSAINFQYPETEFLGFCYKLKRQNDVFGTQPPSKKATNHFSLNFKYL